MTLRKDVRVWKENRISRGATGNEDAVWDRSALEFGRGGKCLAAKEDVPAVKPKAELGILSNDYTYMSNSRHLDRIV